MPLTRGGFFLARCKLESVPGSFKGVYNLVALSQRAREAVDVLTHADGHNVFILGGKFGAKVWQIIKRGRDLKQLKVVVPKK